MNKTQCKSSIKNYHKKLSQRGYSLHHLYFLNMKLENEKQNSKMMLEKIKQEQNISNKIGEAVNTSIAKIQSEGINFAVKIEQQRRKNLALSALVSHYQILIYNQKKQNQSEQTKPRRLNKSPILANTTFYEDSKQQQQNSNPKKNQQCLQKLKQLKQLQKLYEQYILKANTSEYELSKKLDQVSILRSQRTVFNKVFDQFEGEIFQHQLLYKQLVIQRSVLENKFQEEVKEFQQINRHAEKQYDKLVKNMRKRTEASKMLEQVSALKDESQSNNQIQNLHLKSSQNVDQDSNYIYNPNRNTFLAVNSNQNQQKALSIRFSTNHDKQGASKSRIKQNMQRTVKHGWSRSLNSRNKQQDQHIQEKQWTKLQYEKKVKNILEELNLKDYNQIFRLIDNIDESVQNLYKQCEDLYNTLYQKQNKYCGMFKNLQRKRCFGIQSENNQFMTEAIKKYQNIRSKMKQVSDSTCNTVQQIVNFDRNQLKKIFFFEICNKNSKQQQNKILSEDQLYNVDQIAQKMSEIQQKIFNLPAETNEPSGGDVSMIKMQSNDRQSLKQQQYQKLISVKTQKSPKTSLSYIKGHNKTISADIVAQLSKFNQGLKCLTYRDKDLSVATKPGDQLAVQDQFDNNRLQMILKANRTTHNNTTIFTEQQLIKISRFKLQNSKKNMNQLQQDKTKQKTKQDEQIRDSEYGRNKLSDSLMESQCFKPKDK